MSKSKVNTNVALVAIFLAIVLWSWVTMVKNYTFVIPMPLNVSELPQDRVLNERLPDSIYVRISGNGNSMVRLYFSNPRFNLNLGGIKSSQRIELRQRIEDVELPNETNLTLVEIVKPKHINVDFSEKMVKSVAVTPDLHFSVEPGYIWVETRIVPNTVNLQGAADLIQTYKEIKTERVEYIKPLRLSIERLVALDIPVASNIHVNSPQVKMLIDIQRLAENVIRDIPVKVINTPKGISATSLPPTMSVVIKGGDKVVAQVTRDNVFAFINYETDYVSSRKRYVVNLNLSENVDLVSSEPQYFDILIKEK